MLALRENQKLESERMKNMAVAVRAGRFMKDKEFQAWIGQGEGKKPAGIRHYPKIKKRLKK